MRVITNLVGIRSEIACRQAAINSLFLLHIEIKILTNRAAYLGDIRITVGRSDTRAKAYNDIIGKNHALFEGKGDVQLESTIWKPIRRL